MAEGMELNNKELMRTGSLCSPDPHAQLLASFTDRDFDNFQRILTTGVKNTYIDPNYWYDDPHHGTLLDLASRKPSSSQYVRCLLSCGADPNKINPVRKKAPLHFAIELGDLSIVNLLLHDNRTDVNILDTTGSSPLLSAAKSKNVDCMISLLNHPKVNVNQANRKGQTAMHIAATQGSEETVLCLLQHHQIDIDHFKTASGKSARDLILDNYPELEGKLPGNDGKPLENGGLSNNLFNLLHKHDIDDFIRAIQINTDSINQNDGLHTFLQYACDFGLLKIVESLLRLGADPNATHAGNRQTPIMIASFKGYVNIVRLLSLNDTIKFNPVDNETVLHSVIKGSTELQLPLGAVKEHRDHYKCMEILLKNVQTHRLNINCGDIKGNTALHFAAKLGNKEFILLLLYHGAYVGQRNNLGEPALADVSPKIFEKYLDDCLTTNDKLPREDNYEIIFKYNFLAPPKVQKTEDVTSSRAMLQMESHVKPAEQADEIISETDPLLYMSRSADLRPLLKHPVLTSFLHLKWHRIRCFFYCNLTFYVIFWALLTAYILMAYGSMKPSNGPDETGTGNISTTLSKTITKRNVQDTLPESDRTASTFILWLLVALSLAVLVVRELFQLTISPLRYVANPENWLEVGLIVVTISILFCHSCVSLRHQISAVAILLSWAELVLLIGRHPALSTNIEMLKTVSWNFLKFLAWYSILIIAFALSFYTLFCDSETQGEEENYFVDPAMSVFKTVVMLTGEFDAGSIPFVSHPGTSHVLFVLFVFLIAIVLFNLLNGLAVSDTQSIKADAELVGYVSRVKLVTYVESMVMGTPTPYRGFINKLQKLFCCLPRFDCCTISYGCLRIFSHRVNLFPDLYPDCEVRILPNQESRIEMFSRGHRRKRQDIESESENACYETCYTMTMDPVIVRAAKEILVKKTEENERKSRGDPAVMFETYCKELQNYTHTFNSILRSNKNNENAVRSYSEVDNKPLLEDLSRRLDEYKDSLDKLIRNSERTDQQMERLLKHLAKGKRFGGSSTSTDEDNQ